MHILMVSDVYFPRVNGVSTSIRTFRRELNALGHQVTLIAPDYGEVTDDESWIIRVPARTVIVDPEDRMMKFGDLMALTPRLADIDFDVLHIQTPFIAHYAGLRLARRLDLPTVLSYHTYFEQYLHHYLPWLPKGLIQPVVRRFSRKQCADVDAVVVPTTAFSQVLEGYGIHDNLHICPTGIDLSRFSHGDGARFREQQGIDPTRPVTLYVGRVVHEKNIGFLLQVIGRVREQEPRILFVIAGEGPAEGSLRRRVAELELQESVLFVGNLHHLGELLDCYCAADMFIFASRTETQGLVLLEAMALGVPVVSTAEMGTRDILVEQSGACVVPEELPAFADAVVGLLMDPSKRERMRQQGLAYVQSWSAEAKAERMAAIYRGVCPAEAETRQVLLNEFV